MASQIATTIKERPILFAGRLVRAILDRRKTQTRRPIIPQPARYGASDAWGLTWQKKCGGGCDWLVKYCPFGKPGDRLWVRETWSPDHEDFYPNYPVVYRADYHVEIEKGKTYSPEQKRWYPFRWRPSIHMPRWASRINLEITSVGVQQVQQISEADAINGGAFDANDDQMQQAARIAASERREQIGPIDYFREQWETIYAARGYSWRLNPWVWVIDFKLIYER